MLEISVIKVGVQGPAGPQGGQGVPGTNGTNGTDATVNAASVTAAVLLMNAGQITNVLTALGIPTYAGMAAANAALNIGDVFRDSSDSNKLKAATA